MKQEHISEIKKVSKIFDTKRVAREMEIPDEEYERLEKEIKGGVFSGGNDKNRKPYKGI